jgi:hypothetical protein
MSSSISVNALLSGRGEVISTFSSGEWFAEWYVLPEFNRSQWSLWCGSVASPPVEPSGAASFYLNCRFHTFYNLSQGK